MFKNAKVGARVWSIQYGWGIIKYIINLDNYKLVIDFEDGIKRFTIDGKYNETDKYPSLFWQEFEIPEQALKKLLPDLEVDTKIIAWMDKHSGDYFSRFRCHFSHFTKDGKIACFHYGKTSFTVENKGEDITIWDNWVVYEEG